MTLRTFLEMMQDLNESDIDSELWFSVLGETDSVQIDSFYIDQGRLTFHVFPDPGEDLPF